MTPTSLPSAIMPNSVVTTSVMTTAGLYGASRRRWVTTTVRDRAAKPAPDLIERNFTATAPNRWWVADISYIPTWAGFLYLAVVLHAFSRKIVGWAMETHLRTNWYWQPLTWRSDNAGLGR